MADETTQFLHEHPDRAKYAEGFRGMFPMIATMTDAQLLGLTAGCIRVTADALRVFRSDNVADFFSLVLCGLEGERARRGYTTFEDLAAAAKGISHVAVIAQKQQRPPDVGPVH